MKLRKSSLISCFAAGAVITALVTGLNISREYGAIRSVCDGLFIAATLLLGIGGIKFARNRGIFDLAGYGISTAFYTALPMLRQREKESAIEYVERKREERKPAAEMLIAGAAYLVLSLAALLIYELTY